MDDQTAFLAGILPDEQVAQIAKQANVPPGVVADAMAFEKKWTEAGLPQTADGMAARTALGQATLVLALTMNVPVKLLCDYVTAVVDETKVLNAKYGAAGGGEPTMVPTGDEPEPAAEPGDAEEADDDGEDEDGAVGDGVGEDD